MARCSKTKGAGRESSLEVSTGSGGTADSCGSGDPDELLPTNLTVWTEAFSLRSFRPQIRKELTRRAPFLLGSEQAEYTREFFADVGGLCNEGIPFRKLKDDHGITMEELSRIYPLNRKGNRHPMKLIRNGISVRNAQRMHQKVYGGSGPDNGEYGTAFLRGVELQFRHKKKVNWAEAAAELASQRMKNSGQNPQKMTPPCIRQQIQGLLDLFEHLMGRALNAHGAAVAQLKEAKLNVRQEARIDREFSGVLATGQAGIQRSGTKQDFVAAAMVEVAVQQITTPRQARTAKANAGGQRKEGSKVAGLLRKKAVAELEHTKFINALEHAQVDLNNMHERRKELAKAEEALWDEFSALQSAKKEGGHDAAALKTLDSRVRAVMFASGKASEAVEKNQEALIEKTTKVEVLRHKVSTLQAEIQDMDCQIDLIIIEESFVRPQQFFTSFPTVPTSMTPLKDKLPCGLCGRFWAEMALANLPCGCLFHPCCMFKIVLGKNPRCPSCDHVPGGVWMGQWGLVTNNATMQASIEAYRAVMDTEGWAPPLSREDALARIREIAIPADAIAEPGWSMRKRTALDSECDLGGGPAKLARANATKTMAIPTDRVEGLHEAQVVPKPLLQHSDTSIHPLGILDQQALPSFRVDLCPSLGFGGLTTTENSKGVLDEVAVDVIQIANDAAAEVEERVLVEEEADSYIAAAANEAVANFADANGVDVVADASDAVANIADANEGG